MKILKRWLNQTTKHIKRPAPVPLWLFLCTLFFSIIGFADALYLTIVHFKDELPPCTIEGCEKVLTSPYAEIAGIPVALLGAIYYGIILTLALIYMEKRFFAKKDQLANTEESIETKYLHSASWYIFLAMTLTHIGFFATLWFLFLQYFIIQAWCQYCLLSALSSIGLWVVGRCSNYFALPEVAEV